MKLSKETKKELNGRIAHILETAGKFDDGYCYELPNLKMVFDEVEKDVLSDYDFVTRNGTIFENRTEMKNYVLNLTLKDLFSGKVI